jgi:tripartite-type tricarboxylate transporter receptor subunit TctC
MKKILLTLIFSVTWNYPLYAQTPYYQGKTMTIVVGTVAGDIYDLYARAIALTMGKYLPGNPNIIVQNMPGAGHMIAANYLYGVAKPDGLTIAGILPTLYFEQLIGRAEVKFDWTKFNWIGNATKSPQVLYMRADAPYKTMDYVRNAKEPPKCGTTGTSNMGYFIQAFGRNHWREVQRDCRLSGRQQSTSVEKGEIQCRSLSAEAFFSREPFHTWRKKGFVRVLAYGGKSRGEKLPDAPTVYELLDKYKTPELGRRLATALLAAGEFHRPYIGPPNLRPEHVKMLREAFDKTMKDPGFVAEAAKKKLDIDPTTGAEVEVLIKEVMSQPKDVIERLKVLMGQ